jgi:RNA polymerase sigma-70 factor (ECF subfamily)
MADDDASVDDLLDRAARGDAAARDRLLGRHRGRLRQLVVVRMDRRLTARLDPSDVVQDTLADAARRLPDFLSRRPLPFYAWLRQLACERLTDLYRRHVRAGKRSVIREEPQADALPDESALELADRLLARGSSPSWQLQRRELVGRVHRALARLAAHDREVLVLRHLEQLSMKEIADILRISEGAVKVRHLRALERLRDLLGDVCGEGLR